MTDVKRHVLIDDLIEYIKDSAKNVMPVYDEDLADNIATAAAVSLAEKWAGQAPYIPMDLNYHITSRNLEIYHKFTGRNHAQLATEYKMSVQAVYSIVKKIRTEEIKKKQPDLFLSSPYEG